MHVPIINPPWPGKGFGTRSQNRIIKHRSDRFLQYPLFLGYSAAALKAAGHKVSYVDSVIQDLNMEQTLQTAGALHPDVIFMETTTPSIEADYDSLSRLKAATRATILVGGPHATVFHQDVLRECPAIDVVIRNEFDSRIAPVVSGLNHLENIRGVTFRKNGRIHGTEDAEFCSDLDSLPFPDRDTVPWHWYLEAWYSRQPFMNLMTSRGCPYHCAFCLWPHTMTGHRQRFRSLDNVFDEIRFLCQRYGLKELNIDDDTFTTRKSRVIEFCRRLRQYNWNLVWTCNGRVDNLDDEMLAEMKAAGCKMIRIGVESGNQEVLNQIRKGLTREQIKTGFRMVKKHGIQALGGFMFGFPQDSAASIEETIAFAKKLSPDQVQFSIAMCYPGTPLYDHARENGLLVVNSFREFDMTCGPVVRVKGVPREALAHILARAYREYYFRPAFLLQTFTHLRDIDEIRRVLRSLASLVRTIRMHRSH